MEGRVTAGGGKDGLFVRRRRSKKGKRFLGCSERKEGGEDHPSLEKGGRKRGTDLVLPGKVNRAKGVRKKASDSEKEKVGQAP